MEPSQPEPPADGGETCPFCKIAATYPPYDPRSPPPPSSPILSPDLPHPSPLAFILLSTPLLIAFLDIMPLSRGHLLLCPRAHRPRLTDASEAESRELGSFVRVLSGALVRATGVADWNVVQNNGAAAAQVVGHAHFHVIPRPEIREQGRWSDRFTMFGRGTRSELDDVEGAELARRIRWCVAEILAGAGEGGPAGGGGGCGGSAGGDGGGRSKL